MEGKKLKYINKAYDSLYDVESRFGLFLKELEAIEEYMKEQGYKVKINSYDKCVFVKAGDNPALSFNLTKRQTEKFNKQMESYRKGIIEDLKMGRDISAIVSGYGFMYETEHDMASKWIQDNIYTEIKGGNE